MDLYKKLTAKPYAFVETDNSKTMLFFLVIYKTLASNNQLSCRKNIKNSHDS